MKLVGEVIVRSFWVLL